GYWMDCIIDTLTLLDCGLMFQSRGGQGSSHSHSGLGPLALRVCRKPAELCESLHWIRPDRVVRIHVGGTNLPLPVDDVPGRHRNAIRWRPVQFIKPFAE